MSGNFNIQLKTLQLHSIKQDNYFLNNIDNKLGIIKLIKKNKLSPLLIEYLWQKSYFRKDIILKQILPSSIRQDIIEICSHENYIISYAPVLKNFLKFHSPTDDELIHLLSPNAESIMLLEAWTIIPVKCYNLGLEATLYNIIIDNEIITTYALKKFKRSVIEIMKYVPEMHFDLINTIFLMNESFIKQVLTPIFKSVTINDEIVDLILNKLKADTFKEVIKNAMRRGNISDNMLAKIYLALD